MRRLALVLTLASLAGSGWAFGPEPADAMVTRAQARAKAEKKTVFLAFHASWCGWCKRLEAWLERPAVKPVWEKHFVTVWLTVMESEDKKALENPGGASWLERVGGKGEGLPFFALLTSTGSVAADSRRVESGKRLGNVGYPAAHEEVAWFLTAVQSSTKITPAEIAVLKRELEAAAPKR